MSVEKLLVDAKSNGYEVDCEHGVTFIRKKVKTNKHGTRFAGLAVYEDGTAFRLDVDIAIAKAIRSLQTMRNILGI